LLAYHRLTRNESLPYLVVSYHATHGTASGDPLADAVIIWTRYTPASVDDDIELEFRMAAVNPNLVVEDHLDPEKNPNLRRGFVTVTSASDFVAKIDVTGLESGTDFVFAFSHGEYVSDVGQTKTAPANDADVESLTYAVFSCAHFANGYFHSYDLGSVIKDIDFWVHVGDYLVSMLWLDIEKRMCFAFV
jgi:alkaline phosphatase D